ncbi:MAG: LemA family protein [Chloroflexi bacterium]|nr:MAG: LemA family protein [Chloroflexota bacterium]
MPGWIVLAVVVAILLVLLAVFYNRFVALRQQVRAAYSDIDVQLKRRHDLIPNLIEAVKGYAAHERRVFDEVAKARADAIAAGSEPPAERATAENTLSGAVRSLFAVAEAYPQLQAVQEFKDLSSNLTATEDTLQYARRYYNAQVRDYNTAIATFPGVALAPMLGFSPYQFFELDAPTDRELPQVKLTPPI